VAYIGQEPGQGTAQRSIFTAVGVTDTVTADDDGLPLNYTVGQVSVYLNGVKQVVGTDVTCSNGSTVVFDSDYAIGDVIEVIALSTFSPADTVPATGGTFTGVVTLPSPALTGVPVTTTASAATNTTQVASTAFVRTEVTNLIDSAPGALDTLNELAAALGDDAAFSTTVTNSIAAKAALAGATFTGDVETDTTSKIKQKGAFMQSSTHQALTLGG